MRIVEPQSEEEAAAILRCAHEDGSAVIPRGGGTKSDWGNPPARTDFMLSTARLNRVIEHAWADLTVTVEAGCTIAILVAVVVGELVGVLRRLARPPQDAYRREGSGTGAESEQPLPRKCHRNSSGTPLCRWVLDC